MRIKQIEINGLFDMFNHTIKLNQDKRLTIVYGENGIGKTMIMTTLQACFSYDSFSHFSNNYFSDIFKNLKLFFDDNSCVTLKFDDKKKPKILYNDELTTKELELDDDIIIKICKAISVSFVKTNRLTTISYNKKEPISEKIEKVLIENTATLYAQDLAEKMGEKHLLYNQTSDELKESLNQRVIEKKVKSNISIDELKAIVKDVEKTKSKYKEVGLIADTNGKITIPDDIDEVNKAILAVNIQDIQSQLKIYERDNFYERLRLFIEILNKRRFSYKKISISFQNGFIFHNSNGKLLDIDELSSGEQHELVLFYQLLFKIPENSLILIDEPEISLHITWQKEFTNDMEDIIKLRNFDILLATHSPAIINGNWEITQSLNGYEETE